MLKIQRTTHRSDPVLSFSPCTGWVPQKTVYFDHITEIFIGSKYPMYNLSQASQHNHWSDLQTELLIDQEESAHVFWSSR